MNKKTVKTRSLLTCLLTFGQACSRSVEQMRASFCFCLIAALSVVGLNSACGQGVFENVDVNEFTKLASDTNIVVLDVRTASEFAEGHLERAINIDYQQSDFMEKAKATLPLDKKIAVYCRSGRRSAGAAGKLGEEGYKLVNLKGGIIAWKEANMPVTKE